MDPSKKMKKIDAHLHVNLHNYDVDTLIQYLDNNKIDKCWLLTWEELSPPIPSIYNNLSIEDVINAYNKYSDRIVPFYAPDPKSLTIAEDIAKLIDAGLKGCGELKVTYKWEDNVIEKYLDIISGFDLPLLFHMELPRMQYVPKKANGFEKMFEKLMNGAFNGVTRHYITKVSQMTTFYSNHIKNNSVYFPGYLYDFDNLEKRIIQYPNLTFIGHGPHFWNSISSDFSSIKIHQKGKFKSFGIIDALLENYDNFYCDISGKSGFNALNRDIDQTKIFLQKHFKKLLFGTDNTIYDFESFLMSLNLPEEMMERIFYRNANEIIK